MTILIHARSLVFLGFKGGDSVNSGRRTYTEREIPDRHPDAPRSMQPELVCGVGLNDVHRRAVAATADPFWHYPWATLKSHKSRDARLVTCPECARRLREAGFVHAPQVGAEVSP